jgi:hypothetical protein
MTNTIEQLEKQVNYAGPIWTNEDELEFYFNYTPNHYYYLDENDDFFYYIDYFEGELDEIILKFEEENWSDIQFYKDLYSGFHTWDQCIQLKNEYEEEKKYDIDGIDIPEDEFEELQSEEYHLDLFERWLFGEDMYHEWNPIEWCLSEQDMIDYEIDIHEHEVEEIVYNLVTFPRICFRFGYYRNYDD